MEVLLLGPVEVREAGRSVPLGGPRQRSALVALAADVGGAVPVDALIDRIWGQAPPPHARHALHAYIARIRRLLSHGAEDPAPTRVVRRSGGYALEIDPDRVDICRFRRLVDQTRDRKCSDQRRVTLLGEALDLWRGPPLVDLQGEWAARVREGWQRQHVDAVLAWARACLRADDPDAVLARLTDLVHDHPTVEPLVAALIRALHATGRTAEALNQYDRVRRLLRSELGVDPGPELQQLHQQMITAVPATGPAMPPAMAPTTPPVPRQLPAPPRLFTGRASEIDQLDRLESAGATVLASISGMAGIGKTTLVLQWAHRVTDRYPDGQLYVNLRGFDPGGAPTEPATAIRRFLDALDVPALRVPADPDAQVAMYRSLLAGRRMLVVLDNARDADQVRPLLPGAPGCLTVVTSRNRLTGLVATEGAHPLALDLLSPAESRELLARRLGAERIAAEPDAVGEIVTYCARLPLALAIAAARAATHPGLALTTLAAELRNAHSRLDALDTGDAAADVRAVFSWSYQHVSTAAAGLFRLLGPHPGPDISVAAAASLAGSPASEVISLLAELTQAQLLTEQTPGRYTCHDLLRAYAAGLADGDDETAARDAVRRVLDHYLHTGYRAARLLHPLRQRFVPADPAVGVVPEDLTGSEHATSWLTAEHQSLLAAVSLAAATGHDRHACQLAWCLTDFLDWRGHWLDWETVQQIAIDAAQRLGDPIAEALAHRGMAGSHLRRGDYDTARLHLERALALLSGPDAADERAEAYGKLATVCGRQGRFAETLRHAQQALDLHRANGNQVGECHALETVAWAHLLLGDNQQALTYGRRSLALAGRLDNREAEAASWDTLGQAHHNLADYAEALTCQRNALALCRALGNRYFEARALDRAGDAHEGAGDLQRACRHWRDALAILDELGNPEAAQLRTKLQRAEG